MNLPGLLSGITHTTPTPSSLGPEAKHPNQKLEHPQKDARPMSVEAQTIA
jgi:hypothetical protein